MVGFTIRTWSFNFKVTLNKIYNNFNAFRKDVLKIQR